MKRIFILTTFLIFLIVPKVSAEVYGQVLVTLDEPDSSNFAEEVLRLCNIERANYGIAPLELDENLIECADIRAEEIVEEFSHTRPDGTSCFSVLKGISYYTCGENIAAGHSTPEETVDQWMNSAGHRANILNGEFTKLGVGYCYDENGMYKNYWVQLFIG